MTTVVRSVPPASASAARAGSAGAGLAPAAGAARQVARRATSSRLPGLCMRMRIIRILMIDAERGSVNREWVDQQEISGPGAPARALRAPRRRAALDGAAQRRLPDELRKPRNR